MVATVAQLKRNSEIDDKKEVYIYNPATKPFKVKYLGEMITLPAMDMLLLPLKKANHVKKHLVDHLMNKRGLNSRVVKLRKRIELEVEVKL